MTISLALSLFFVSLLSALAVVVVVARFVPRRMIGASSLFHDPQQAPIFLFDDETLLDASDSARALLAASRMRGTPWQRFMGWAGPRFPDLESALHQLPEKGRISLLALGSDPSVLVAEWRGGLRRIVISDSNLAEAVPLVDAMTKRAIEDELLTLREVTDAAPFPVWTEGADHRIIWANAAYISLITGQGDADDTPRWPLPRLFAMPQEDTHMRLSLTLKDEQHWFDCHQVPARVGRLVYVIPADPVVRAEDALRSFVQTLTKTFAQLPIGLAIFDANRKLQLFNPALTDLTGLPIGFLSARPALFAFLDAMRERQMIPEPRDYKTWRTRMAAVERSAAEGSYEETWTLPSGATYQVSGRPHPEGALALLIRDISDDMQRARRARTETELSQAVIESMEEAIAVFPSSGDLLMANASYAALWGHDPGATLEPAEIGLLANHWRAATGPAAVWTLVEAFALAPAPRESWSANVRLKDGRDLACRFVPLPGGATMVGFRKVLEGAATDTPVFVRHQEAKSAIG